MSVVALLVWALTDNLEWGSYTPRFGLYTVDIVTDPQLRRIPTAAVPVCQGIIRQNGVEGSYVPKDLAGLTVAVQGLGNVGLHLCEHLQKRGSRGW